MTDQQINIAIAESLGNKDIKPRIINGKIQGYVSPDCGLVPSYTTDLNAIIPVVETLRHKDGPEWFDYGKLMLDHYGSTMNCIQASARQRAIAYLKTINKYKD